MSEFYWQVENLICGLYIKKVLGLNGHLSQAGFKFLSLKPTLL